MSLTQAVADPAKRRMIAADAVNEAELAVAAIGGVRGNAARLAVDVINRLRPGFLQRHLHQILPAMAQALDPYWQEGVSLGDPSAHFQANADEIALKLLIVTDRHAARASDSKATAVYNRLRPSAPERVAEHMPAIVTFVSRHAVSAVVDIAGPTSAPAKSGPSEAERARRRERRNRRAGGNAPG